MKWWEIPVLRVVGWADQCVFRWFLHVERIEDKTSKEKNTVRCA